MLMPMVGYEVRQVPAPASPAGTCLNSYQTKPTTQTIGNDAYPAGA